jgi:hypothetical protein
MILEFWNWREGSNAGGLRFDNRQITSIENGTLAKKAISKRSTDHLIVSMLL